MSESFFSFSEPLNSGIDFFTSDDFKIAASELTIESNVVVLSRKIAFSQIAIDSNSSVQTNAFRIIHAVINLAVDGAVVTVGRERQDALVNVSANATMAVNFIKIAHSASALSSSSTLSQAVTKIANGASALSASANISAVSFKIASAVANLSASAGLSSLATKITKAASVLTSSLHLSIAGDISLATIRIVLQEVGALAVKTPIVFAQNVASGIDSSIYRTLILLDGKPLTIHNRKIDMGVDQIFTETVNWNNRKTRYYKSNARAGRRIFNMSWSWLPNSVNYTVDGNSGRDFIKNIAEDPRHHILKIINIDETGATPYTETSYNVLVKDYNETLIRRDIPNDVYFWDCAMSLEEV